MALLDTTFRTARTLPATPHPVYAAFGAAEQLAIWWGPDGFRNEFERFDFQPGEAWDFVMIGPDGARHANEIRFVELLPARRIVIQHLSAPHFRLTVELAATTDGTRLEWTQVFEDAAVAQAVSHIVDPANEQNLNRLIALRVADPIHLKGRASHGHS